ncbi:hypothetical protein ZWY2020_008525 [Hordeum vulgare]|nr:hypothetical protein ZWY2020_008525 [Hordeum vulgare]
MAELRHATAAAAASGSPAKLTRRPPPRPPLPLLPTRRRGDGNRTARCARPSAPPEVPHPRPVRALLALEDPRSLSAPASYRILLAVLACVALAALVSAPSVWSRLNAPYLCRKDGIRLQCPGVSDSLWENPHAAATSWKPCAERRSDEISGKSCVRSETSGYIFIHAEGGLNQQRVAHTLILPVLKQDQIWKDQRYSDWFTEKDELFTSIRLAYCKNIPKYAPAQFYVDNVLPRIKESDNINLRCRVNYHALKFLPGIEEMADKLAARMRIEQAIEEKAMMAEYRQKQWPRRFKNTLPKYILLLYAEWISSLVFSTGKEKRRRCPLEPGEIGFILRAMGYLKETQIYVASGQVYGGNNRMAPENMFPNLVGVLLESCLLASNFKVPLYGHSSETTDSEGKLRQLPMDEQRPSAVDLL